MANCCSLQWLYHTSIRVWRTGNEMDAGLTGRTVLVTGGTRGIGRAVALAYAGEGARVAITYASDPAKASETVAQLEAHGTVGTSLYLDLEDNGSIEAAV